MTPLLICGALYWRGLRMWFWQDDFAWLGLKLQVHDFSSFLDAMFAPKAQGTIRPWSERGFFMLFSYWFGLHALPYRFVVFANECANVLLLMLVTRIVTRSDLAGFFAPVFWLFNIGLVMPMAWTSAYNEVQFAGFLLLSIYLFLLYTQTGLTKYYWLQWTTFVLGFGALEINFVYPVLACLYALLFARRYVRSTLPMLGVSAVYVAIDRIATSGGSAAGSYYYDLSFNPVSIVATFGQYWNVLLGVTGYANLHGWQPQIIFAIATLFAIAVVFFVFWRGWRHDFVPLFCVLWFVVILGPLLPLHNHITDYYVAAPTTGLAVLAAYGLTVAFRNGWVAFVPTALLLLLYTYPSVVMINRGLRAYYQRSTSARVLVESVAYAKRIHPNQAILLQGVDDTLFWAAVYDSPFRLFGWNDVLLVPEEKESIHEVPQRGSLDQYFLPSHAALALLQSSRAVVYEDDGRRLENVTQLYTLRASSQPPPPLDSFIDLGVPFYAEQLGPGWYGQEVGYRWASPNAVVYLPGPQSSGQKLYIHGYVTEVMVKTAPLHLALSIDNQAQPVETISTSNTNFMFTYSIPTGCVGHARMEVDVKVDRATMAPGDPRMLGVAFGTFAVR